MLKKLKCVDYSFEVDKIVGNLTEGKFHNDVSTGLHFKVVHCVLCEFYLKPILNKWNLVTEKLLQ